jgi:hypothetical protein
VLGNLGNQNECSNQSKLNIAISSLWIYEPPSEKQRGGYLLLFGDRKEGFCPRSWKQWSIGESGYRLQSNRHQALSYGKGPTRIGSGVSADESKNVKNCWAKATDWQICTRIVSMGFNCVEKIFGIRCHVLLPGVKTCYTKTWVELRESDTRAPAAFSYSL